MRLNSGYRIGLRAIKTAIAVSLCLLISLIFNRPDAFCSSIAAIVCMQQTYDETFNTGLNRFIGTIIGGIMSYLVIMVSLVLPYYTWISIAIIPVALLIAIYFCNMINRPSSVSIACIVVLVIVARPIEGNQDALFYVIDRVLDTIIGVAIAMLVNRFFFPNKKSEDEGDNVKSD